jgi:hypothetical protein
MAERGDEIMKIDIKQLIRIDIKRDEILLVELGETVSSDEAYELHTIFRKRNIDVILTRGGMIIKAEAIKDNRPR